MNFEKKQYKNAEEENMYQESTARDIMLKKYVHSIILKGTETSLNVKNNIWLAPLAGVTDLPFRIICKKSGEIISGEKLAAPGLVFSEMISAKGIHYKGSGSMELANTLPDEGPLSVQIFGNDPDIMAESAIIFKEKGIPAIDINMGCPMQKVTSNNEGSALLKDTALIEKIVKKVSYAAGLPVTVKIRRGFECGRERCVEAAKAAEAGGASAITVHGRYRDEYYNGISSLPSISAVKKAVKIPVIGNGDVISASTALKMFEETGCDGIMIGRGALGRPWIFYTLLTENESAVISPKKINEIINLHIEYAASFKDEKHGITEMRKHLAWYTKGLHGAAAARDRIFKTNSAEEAVNLINELFENI